jgi:hypothetical protein
MYSGITNDDPMNLAMAAKAVPLNNAVKEIIANEMVENFIGCINQWNNGRLDDRGIIFNVDFDQLKARLAA